MSQNQSKRTLLAVMNITNSGNKYYFWESSDHCHQTVEIWKVYDSESDSIRTTIERHINTIEIKPPLSSLYREEIIWMLENPRCEKLIKNEFVSSVSDEHLPIIKTIAYLNETKIHYSIVQNDFISRISMVPQKSQWNYPLLISFFGLPLFFIARKKIRIELKKMEQSDFLEAWCWAGFGCLAFIIGGFSSLMEVGIKSSLSIVTLCSITILFFIASIYPSFNLRKNKGRKISAI